jgi:hypothetical protein
MNQIKTQYSLRKYFDYKRGDKNAKCRICNEKVEKTPINNDSLIDHLKRRHEEFYNMYDSAKRKNELALQQKKRPCSDNYDNEVNESNEETNASQSQPMMMVNAEAINLRKKPRKN